MFIENLVTEFYDVVSKNNMLIFVNYDIDAICAAKILQAILRHDTVTNSVAYVLITVSTVTDLVVGYKEHINDIKNVVMINCGGTIDIIKTVSPEKDVTFFIADSHRPTALNNIYKNQERVHLLRKRDEEENIPDEHICREKETDDEPGEEIDCKEVVRRRNWKENRRRILSDYLQFSYYGRSSAIIMFELSWKLHRDNVDLLWYKLGIVGAVEQFILNKVEMVPYLNEVKILSVHKGRLCPNLSLGRSPTSRIKFEKDLQLALYRHWTIESSMKYTMITAVSLQAWAMEGDHRTRAAESKNRMQRFLAELGVPLKDSRQQYNSVDLTLRRQFLSMMEKMSDSRNLGHIIYPSFTLIKGFLTKYQAADYVYSLLAILSYKARDRSQHDCFIDAQYALSRAKEDLIGDGVEKSKTFLKVMFELVQNALDMQQVISAGPFFYFVIEKDNKIAKYFSIPDCLLLLATFLLKVYVTVSNCNRAARLPLLASAPLDDSYCLIVGVPPVAETAPRSSFGQAFEQVAEKFGYEIEPYFNSSVRVLISERPKILNSLAVHLDEEN